MLIKIPRNIVINTTLFLLILAWGISKSFSLDSATYQAYHNIILQLESTEAKLNQEILRDRYELFFSYDFLVQSISQQKFLHYQLQSIPSFVQGEFKQEILNHLKLQKKLMEQKEARLETFKSKNSALKNSLRYLPFLIEKASPEFQKQSQFKMLEAPLNHLLYDLLLYNLTPDEELKVKIEGQIQNLHTLQQESSTLEIEFPLKLAITHAEIILQYKPVVDQLTNQLLNISLSDVDRDLEKVYIQSYKTALTKINLYRFLTYIWFLLGILIGGYQFIKNLTKSNQKIAKLNQHISELNEQLQVENFRMVAELNILKQMQNMILPKLEELQTINTLDIAAYMEPADEVGGDYYDILDTDGVITIGIGDVTGHGLESGILMLMTQTAVRTLKETQESDPVKFLTILNRTLYKNIQRMNTDKNLTLSILNYTEGLLMISGQHEEVLVVRREGELQRIDTIDLGFPIGLDEEITQFISKIYMELKPEDGIVLYTDGITEACNIDNQQYGLNRLCEVIRCHWCNSAHQIQNAVIEDLKEFIGNQKQFDDITLLILKRK